MTFTASAQGESPDRLSIERRFRASLDAVWALWTTQEGFESWWGPEGFSVRVLEINLRPEGRLRYAMTATGPQQVAYMRQSGMSLTTESTIIFTTVEPPRRLSYVNLIDFVPGVGAYEVATQVELIAEGDAVRMILTFDRMHDAAWTQRMASGWESQLNKLFAVVAGGELGGPA
jgi:uncharacterized protein YndB with AHSA1/START domain